MDPRWHRSVGALAAVIMALPLAMAARHVLLLAFDFQTVVEQVDADVQAVFEQTDVLVAGAEQRLDAAADRHTSFDAQESLATSMRCQERRGGAACAEICTSTQIIPR